MRFSFIIIPPLKSSSLLSLYFIIIGWHFLFPIYRFVDVLISVALSFDVDVDVLTLVLTVICFDVYGIHMLVLYVDGALVGTASMVLMKIW